MSVDKLDYGEFAEALVEKYRSTGMIHGGSFWYLAYDAPQSAINVLNRIFEGSPTQLSSVAELAETFVWDDDIQKAGFIERFSKAE